MYLKTFQKVAKSKHKKKNGSQNKNINNFSKILKASFVKNKGIRRICIILGILILSYNLFNFIQFLRIANDDAIYIEYASFTDLNKDIYNKHYDYSFHKRFDVDDSWKKVERCAEIYFYKTHYILPDIIAECSEKEDVLTGMTCLMHYDDCQKLNRLKEEPIKYYCNGIESLSFKGIISTGTKLTKWFFILLLSYFAPFLIVFFILKPLYKLIYWVYSGFREK